MRRVEISILQTLSMWPSNPGIRQGKLTNPSNGSHGALVLLDLVCRRVFCPNYVITQSKVFMLSAAWIHVVDQSLTPHSCFHNFCNDERSGSLAILDENHVLNHFWNLTILHRCYKAYLTEWGSRATIKKWVLESAEAGRCRSGPHRRQYEQLQNVLYNMLHDD